MSKTLKIVLSVIALMLAFAMGFGTGILVTKDPGQQSQPQPSVPQTEPAATYTVEIKSAGGIALADVGVYIYADSTLQELVWFAKTDAQGVMTFTDKVSDTYVAVLKDVPTGYEVKANYPITGEVTQILLEAGKLDDEVIQEIKYNLGDMMMDFTIIDTDGVEHQLSELLKVKKAVVLNFWYVECAPCKMEFPYLQEAYEQYQDQIALLALNPVNPKESDIAAFKQENGLTFPMAKVDAAWEKMMQLTAYPTTVVIDRLGNICLIHKGSVPDTKTFADTFAYFTADDYVPGVVTDIAELLTEEEVGGEANPLEFGGVTSFEVTLKPGQMVYVDLYKVKDRYLQVKSADCEITYNEKTYTPSNGVVGFMVSAPDNYTPAKLQFVNKGTKEQTFKVTLSALAGTRDNPYTMQLGEFTAKVSAGNDQGVYYRYTATEDGELILRCLSSTVEKYSYSLYNLNSYAMRNLEEDSKTDETSGGKFVSMPAKKGQVVEFSVGALPDSSNSYPAGTFQFNASFTTGAAEEEKEKEKKQYTITVVNDQQQAIAGVNVWFTQKLAEEDSANKKPETFTTVTDENGKAVLELEAGEYTVKVATPADHIQNDTEYTVTSEQTELTVSFKAIIRHSYTVKVVDVFDQPVAGVMLSIGETTLTTDASGIAAVEMEPGDYPVMLFSVPGEFQLGEMFFQFPEGQTELTVTLEYVPGTVNNPYEVHQNPFTTVRIPANGSVYYNVYGANGMVLILQDPDAYVIYQGTTYSKNEAGYITFPVAAGVPFIPAQMQIGNAGSAAKTFQVQFVYPLGSRENPEVIDDIAVISTSLQKGDEDGYFYKWTAIEDADVSFRISDCTEGVTADLSVIVGSTVKILSEDGIEGVLTVSVKKGDELLIQPMSLENAQGDWYPAADITVKSHIAVDSGETDPTDPSVPDSSETETTGSGSNDTETTEAESSETETTESEPTTSETTESEPSASESTEPESSTTETTEPEPSTTQTTEPEPPASETTQPDDGMTDYCVTVQDHEGNPVTGVAIQIRNGNAIVKGGMVDANGQYAVSLEDGTYTVAMVDPTGTYSFAKTGAELTVEEPELVLIVAKPVSDASNIESVCDAPALLVELGGTYVKVDTSQANYYMENGKGYCFFRISISKPGIYAFTTNNGATITNWGSNPHYITNATTDEEYANGKFLVQYKSSNFPEAGAVISHLFAIEVNSETTDTVLLVNRLGDAQYTIDDAPWIPYTDSGTPVCIQVNSKWTPANGNYKLSISAGQSLSYLDPTNIPEGFEVVYSEKDGYYHLGTADGPVLYVNLKYGKYINFDVMINGDGTAGGTSLRAIFYDDDGNPIVTGKDEDGYPVYQKEEYTEAMQKYIATADKTYGVYPLTKGLAHMIQNGGRYYGWYEFENPSYLFDTVNVPEEYAWLFAACYVA